MVAQLLLDHSEHFSLKGVQNLGVVVKMSALFIQMAAYEQLPRLRRRRCQRLARRTIGVKVPDKRLNISGEYYVH